MTGKENNTLLEKLDGLQARFEEVATLITDPEVIADQQRYVRLSKEYKELEELTAARKEYATLLAGLDEAKHLLLTESDPEMKEMAREEVAACEERLPRLEEEIKLMLVPKDPEDGKNAILEIRGGTGGDEAALFAGDLFRMYTKYAERKGWRLEVSSASEGAAGGFKEIVCSVTGADVYGTLKYESGMGFFTDTPKTKASERDIPLTKEVEHYLDAQQKLWWGNVIRMDRYLFCNYGGEPLSRECLQGEIDRVIDRIRKDGYDFPRITSHVFRHTFATRAIESGMKPQILKAILGHSSLAMTMDLYSHVLPDSKAKEMEKIAEAF